MGSFAKELLSNLSDEELEHYGVPGMKWGVRKDRGSKTSPLSRYNEARKSRERYLLDRPRETLSVKTKSGKTMTIVEQETSRFGAWLGSLTKGLTKESENNRFFDFTADGKSVGEAVFSKTSDKSLYLDWLYVHKKQRGQGYGQAAFDAAVAYAKEQGMTKLKLDVPDGADDARHIYEQRGFVVNEWKLTPGLTEMSLDLTKLDHEDLDSDELERAFELTFKQPTPEEERKYLDMTHELSLGPVGERTIPNTPPNELEHYGVPGMKWGVRKDRGSKAAGSNTKKKRKRPAVERSPEKKMTVEQLKIENERMRLEVEYRKLKKLNTPTSKGKEIGKNIGKNAGKYLVRQGARQLDRAVNSMLDSAVDDLLLSKGLKKKK